MSKRFADMVKVSQEPAAKLMALTNTTLETELDSPASALPEAVLEELDSKAAAIDMLRLLSVLLPARERVWWACLAARDLTGPGPDKATPPLAAAEAWVFKPTRDNRVACQKAINLAADDDETIHSATSALYADGTLGVGDLEEFPAPTGGSEVSAFAMNVVAFGELIENTPGYDQFLIDRAVDIARGGNGRLDSDPAGKKES